MRKNPVTFNKGKRTNYKMTQQESVWNDSPSLKSYTLSNDSSTFSFTASDQPSNLKSKKSNLLFNNSAPVAIATKHFL